MQLISHWYFTNGGTPYEPVAVEHAPRDVEPGSTKEQVREVLLRQFQFDTAGWTSPDFEQIVDRVYESKAETARKDAHRKRSKLLLLRRKSRSRAGSCYFLFCGPLTFLPDGRPLAVAQPPHIHRARDRFFFFAQSRLIELLWATLEQTHAGEWHRTAGGGICSGDGAAR